MTVSLLLVGGDPVLREELQSALEQIPQHEPVLFVARDWRAALEMARGRPPEVVLVELDAEPARLRAFAQDLAAAAPQAVLVGIFEPQAVPPEVPESAFLIEALRNGVRDFTRRPISTLDLDQLLARLEKGGSRRPASGAVCSFLSNKGGVGKSTLAVNAAVLVAQQHPRRVLLVDASLQLGVAASLLDVTPVTTLTDAARERQRLDETLIRELATPHESGLDLLAAPRSAVEAAQIDDELLAQVITLARRSYDLVVVDTFPLLDRIVVAILDLTQRAYLVTENTVPTILGASQLLTLLDRLGFPAQRRRIVLNRYLALAGSPRPLDVARQLGCPVDFVLPYDKQVLIAANTGQPLVLRLSRFWGLGPPLRALAADMETLAGSLAVGTSRHPPTSGSIAAPMPVSSGIPGETS
jgi:pilus assembly protein CpaE